MNKQKLDQYIQEYEKQFPEIDKREIYKWQAVQHFRNHWNLDAPDFPGMLDLSLAKTNNLMDSGSYFPKRMIVQIAEKSPEIVRKAFVDLYDEDQGLIVRINNFREPINDLNAIFFPGKSSYQDQRAVMVYLTLKYPDTYYFYKYRIFKEFCKRLECFYQPKSGSDSNIIQFMNICKDVKEKIKQNNHLLKLHQDRIGEKEFLDISCNILTQDFLHAVTAYLNIDDNIPTESKPKLFVHDLDLIPIEKEYDFQADYFDPVSQYKRNKQVGALGERIVLEHEKEENPKYADKIIHASNTEGDGLGYDILSYDQEGKEKYIEVKTTKGPANTRFFITGTELARSKKEGEKYYLYRLYNFDENNNTADMFILQGDLSKYCNNPTEFEVILLEVDSED